MSLKVLLPILIVITGIGFWTTYEPSDRSGEEVSEESTIGDNDEKDGANEETSTEVNTEEDSVVKSIANDEKLIEQLKENGVIPKDATGAEIEEILKKYLKEKNFHHSTEGEKKKKEYIKQLKEDLKNKGLTEEGN
ncbi:hypothetical protein [Pseudalkalibacillus decolorationis]|uniref:hypothetical protein n=1 Tax=Pseudalkalibacillus decolorationis TaxID=163879 RepID=UPI002148BF0C|nr:hypothetical protein [Pseudalkalibacillus decolorationis]